MNDHYDEGKDYEPVKNQHGCIPVLTTAFIILIAVIIMSAIMTSCKTQYIPVEKVRTEYQDRLERDSIHIHDSIYVREKGDTVWFTRWRVEYRDRLKVDSIHVRDSVPVPYPVEVIKEVEKKLNGWQKLKLEVGGIALGGIIIIIIYLIFRIVKRIKSVGWKSIIK